ncbi:MAG: TraB/GumN family protein [Asticcacaulis sp.]
MHVANFRENPFTPSEGGQLSWAVDLAIVAGATACIFVTVIPAGLWVHRGQQTAAPVVFAGAGHPDAAEAQAGPTGAPLLWRVRQGASTLYLFGTVSTHHRDLGWTDSRLFQAFDHADSVWFDRVPPPAAEGNLKAERGPALLLSQRAVRLNKPVTELAAPAPATQDVVMTSLWRNGDERALLARSTFLGTVTPGGDTSRL